MKASILEKTRLSEREPEERKEALDSNAAEMLNELADRRIERNYTDRQVFSEIEVDLG